MRDWRAPHQSPQYAIGDGFLQKVVDGKATNATKIRKVRPTRNIVNVCDLLRVRAQMHSGRYIYMSSILS